METITSKEMAGGGGQLRGSGKIGFLKNVEFQQSRYQN